MVTEGFVWLIWWCCSFDDYQDKFQLVECLFNHFDRAKINDSWLQINFQMGWHLLSRFVELWWHWNRTFHPRKTPTKCSKWIIIPIQVFPPVNSSPPFFSEFLRIYFIGAKLVNELPWSNWNIQCTFVDLKTVLYICFCIFWQNSKWKPATSNATCSGSTGGSFVNLERPQPTGPRFRI